MTVDFSVDPALLKILGEDLRVAAKGMSGVTFTDRFAVVETDLAGSELARVFAAVPSRATAVMESVTSRMAEMASAAQKSADSYAEMDGIFADRINSILKEQ